MPITTDVAHEAAFGELRVHSIQLFMPIGDAYSTPVLIDALQDYIDSLLDKRISDGPAHNTFVADNGTVIRTVSCFPLVAYLDAIKQQGG